MAEVVYRLLQGEGIALEENSGTKTVTISVPALSTKLNVGDIVQATQLQPGIAEIATNAEVQAGTDPDRIVTPAGLAAAAQAALDDATAMRLMRVGGFGLGAAALVLTSANLNADRPTGFYYCVTCTNGPISSGATGDGWLLHRDHSVSGYSSQIYESGVVDRVFFRRQVAGTWSSWRELYHTSNFDPNAKANTSGNYAGLVVGNSAQVGGQTAEMLVPPGAVMDFAMPTPPSGWLAANGAAVSRSTYAALFAAIGTTYGAGNGSSTFNLPDPRGLFRRSWDNGRGIDPGRGFGSTQSSANLQHSHAAGAAGAHAHGASADSQGAHSHSMLISQGNTAGYQGSGGPFHTWNLSTNLGYSLNSPITGNPLMQSAGAHSHNISIGGVGDHSHAIGNDGGGESRPINVAFLTCIKY